jgi:bifunctional DNA-binding transcriptional regulator/antitoxin component of YhaV-PrlF toxin-antitoxin module
MQNICHKVIDDSGRVLIPAEMRKMAEMQDNDIVRMCVYNKMLIMERVELPSIDLVGKLRQSLDKPEKPMPDDAIECFIVAAVAGMHQDKQSEMIARLAEITRKK